ncbi:MAG: ParB/RepB/Spo0J family partition protein [Cyanobacteria bacterium SZAS LIN-2]|nr:ParB/RepB/Spo0J family partition protein [Cyanobacteria bacterium SZAS LIN-2]
MSKRDELGKGVLADLAALRERNAVGSILPSRRADPVPKTIAHEMSEGYIQTIARLKAERESGKVVLELDPKQVRASALANRSALSLDAGDADLKRLKEDIAAQGQLEPIRVRPAGDADGTYEIVYGHRRHAACLALDAETSGGWKVLALLDGSVAELRHLVLKMYQENAARKDLSAYEQGHMFRLWLEEKVFESQTAIAEQVGVSRQLVSKYLKLIELPEEIFAAFGDPRVVALRWVDALEPVLAADRAGILARARKVAGAKPRPEPEAVLTALLTRDAEAKPKRTPASESDTFRIGRETIYKLSRRGSRVAFRFGNGVPPAVAREAVEQMQSHLRSWLKKRLPERKK